MYQDIKKGGLNVPSIVHKQESMTVLVQSLRKLKKIELNHGQHIIYTGLDII